MILFCSRSDLCRRDRHSLSLLLVDQGERIDYTQLHGIPTISNGNIQYGHPPTLSFRTRFCCNSAFSVKHLKWTRGTAGSPFFTRTTRQRGGVKVIFHCPRNALMANISLPEPPSLASAFGRPPVLQSIGN